MFKMLNFTKEKERFPYLNSTFCGVSKNSSRSPSLILDIGGRKHYLPFSRVEKDRVSLEKALENFKSEDEIDDSEMAIIQKMDLEAINCFYSEVENLFEEYNNSRQK